MLLVHLSKQNISRPTLGSLGYKPDFFTEMSQILKYDVMGQDQSHVAKHKMAEICILSENVKICPFLVFIKNKIFV